MGSEPVDHPSAGVPADRGLSSLGLLLQLGGGLAAVWAGMLALGALANLAGSPEGDQAPWVVAAFALCIARSMVLRAAGTELLYGGRKRPDGTTASALDGLRRYVAVALGQTVLLALILYVKLDFSATLTLACAAGLAAWPLALLVILASRELAPLEPVLPQAEDRGFEGASILMTVLGACGVVFAGTLLVSYVRVADDKILEGPGLLAAGLLGALLLRSYLHVRAGLSGLNETSVERTAQRASRYTAAAVATSLILGGIVVFAALATGFDVMAMLGGAALTWMMLAWPLAIRRFFNDRMFADLLTGDRAPRNHRAPDAGLSGLGWLLAVHAGFTASCLVPQLFVGSLPSDAAWLASLVGGGRSSPWWSAGVVVLEAWAAYELLRMRPHHRIVTAAYGIAAVAVVSWQSWSVLRQILDLNVLGRSGYAALVLPLVVVQLVIPILAVLLVRRTTAPTARARYRRAPEQTAGAP